MGMERDEAITRLSALIGQDLRPLADNEEVTVEKGGKINKGWAGHVIERFLGLPLNSAQSPNFGSWELKVIPLKYLRSGVLQVKETMAITMIDPIEVRRKEFEDSHVYSKLRKIVVVSRIFEGVEEKSSRVYSVSQFDLDNPHTFAIVKADYDIIRATLIATATAAAEAAEQAKAKGLPDTTGKHDLTGLSGLSGRLGQYIQPRTKGPGHGSVSRAFYARTQFVAHIIGLNAPPDPPIIDDATDPTPDDTAPS